MKLRLLSLASLVLLASSAAFGWNCSDPLASRVDVGPVNPGGSPGDGDGQWFLGTGSEGVKGDYYVCQVPKKTTPPPTDPTTTSSSTSSSTSGASATSGSSSTSGASATGGNSSSTATGGQGGSSSSKSGVSNSGNSTATGGAGGQGGQGGAGGTGIGTGGSVSGSGNSTVGPISTTSTATGGKVSNSGNSSNTNNNTAKGGSANGNGSNNTTTSVSGANGNGSNNTTSQGQQQSNSSTNANQSSASNQSNGNGSNSNNTVNNSVVEAPKIPVNTAYAPTTIPTSPCLKGYEAGGQGAAFGFAIGGSKTDKNCQLLELARSFDSMNERLAGCKVKISSKLSQQAHVTLADCMAVEMIPAPPAVVPPVAPEKPQPIVVVVPQQPQAAVVAPVIAPAPPAAPAIAWESICTFASKTACTVPGSDAVIVDPARPTSVCKLMIDSAVRAFKASPNSRFVLVGNRNRDESDLLPTARANNVRRLLESAGVPASSIAVQVGTGTTRTVEIVLIQSN